MTTAFSSLGIKADTQSFTAPKIRINKVLDQPITVKAFRIVDSKFKENGDGRRLDLDITFNDKPYIIWTSSQPLKEMIAQVPADKFPFVTVIKEDNERFLFT